LQSSFNRLNSGADALVQGNTGLLSMDPNLRIHRELSPATFDRGEIQAQ
jgi:outer membrane PBP1 activator LpoA protein